MARNNGSIDFRYYDDTNISSIYLNVYKQTLVLPRYTEITQRVIDRFASTHVTNIDLQSKSYNSDFLPHFRFVMHIAANVGDPFRTADVASDIYNDSPDTTRYGRLRNRIDVGWDNFMADSSEILGFFAQNVGAERQYPVHMHGLMSMASVKHGTKGNKNLYVPWLQHHIVNDDQVAAAKRDAEERLVREGRRYLDNPDFNQGFIAERNRLGKEGVIAGLKNLKHLPLAVLREALNEFLCMDVMDDDFGV